MSEALVLSEDRYFDPEPAVRRVARELFAETRELPIVSPHGHVDARLLAANTPFPEPASLLVTPDHYIYRLLYSRGVPLESLGISGSERPPSAEARRIWRLFAEQYYLFRGTPTGAWLDYQLYEVFGVRVRLGGETADRIYDQILERLASPEFLPRALFQRFQIECLATTDAASDRLEAHALLRSSGWSGRVIPTFRPDAVFRLAQPGWPAEVRALEQVSGTTITGYAGLIEALAERRAFFRRLGATATDHGVEQPFTAPVSAKEAERLFQRGLCGEATPEDQRRWEGQLLLDMAWLSLEDGLVMQLHAGALRDHNQPLFQRFGPDRGGDIPVATEFTRNLRPLLNAFGNDPAFTLILFTLDESAYSRELAPLASHYPAVRLGAPWWFLDSLDGITRYREATSGIAGIYRTAGFVDDTRAFCSIPARHDLARRVDANWLARLVTRHVIELSDARAMARAMAYELAKEAYRLR